MKKISLLFIIALAATLLSPLPMGQVQAKALPGPTFRTSQSTTPPANDSFSSATKVLTVPYIVDQFDTSGATTASDDPTMCNSVQNHNTVWYQYTPSSSGSLTINTAYSDYNTVLGVWTGGEGSLVLVACNDDYSGTPQSQVQISAISGTTYYIEIASVNSGGGSLAFHIINAAPGDFYKTSPSNEATSQPTNLNLNWTLSEGAEEYGICINTTSPCSNWYYVGSNNLGVEDTYLKVASTYYWQVIAINSLGTTYADGGPTAFWSLTTALPFDIFRPSNGTWYINEAGPTQTQYGQNGDIPVPADYNGDGRNEFATFRPSNGTWYIQGVGATQYGQNGDIPVPADYTGAGHAQLAVFRPSNGTWYIKGVGAFANGHYRDIPVPADYNGDGKIELAVFRPSNGIWYIQGVGSFVYGQIGDIPIPGDYNGDGQIEPAVFRPINGTWYIKGVGTYVYGTKGDIPVPGHYQ